MKSSPTGRTSYLKNEFWYLMRLCAKRRLPPITLLWGLLWVGAKRRPNQHFVGFTTGSVQVPPRHQLIFLWGLQRVRCEHRHTPNTFFKILKTTANCIGHSIPNSLAISISIVGLWYLHGLERRHPHWGIHIGASTLGHPFRGIHFGASTLGHPFRGIHIGASTLGHPFRGIHIGASTLGHPFRGIHIGASLSGHRLCGPWGSWFSRNGSFVRM
jgi:hypothetical protein